MDNVITEFLLVDASTTKDEMNITSERVAAKTVSCGDKSEFYIKSSKGLLYNPLSVNYVPRIYIDIHWKWRKVDIETFTNYVKFIQTKNEAYYKQAERMKMINGV